VYYKYSEQSDKVTAFLKNVLTTRVFSTSISSASRKKELKELPLKKRSQHR